jgi:hypothetical protein
MPDQDNFSAQWPDVFPDSARTFASTTGSIFLCDPDTIDGHTHGRAPYLSPYIFVAVRDAVPTVLR